MSFNLTTTDWMPIVTTCSPNSTANCTLDASRKSDEVGFNAFLYICAVIVFYALSIVCLLVKYVRREEEDAVMEQYYLDFVKRETFHNLNRHKYYSQLFKKYHKRAGKESLLSIVYNTTDIYARRSLPPSLCDEMDKELETKRRCLYPVEPLPTWRTFSDVQLEVKADKEEVVEEVREETKEETVVEIPDDVGDSAFSDHSHSIHDTLEEDVQDSVPDNPGDSVRDIKGDKDPDNLGDKDPDIPGDSVPDIPQENHDSDDSESFTDVEVSEVAVDVHTPATGICRQS